MPERMRRVNEVLREVLADGVEALGDPGLGFVTVTAVRATPDLSQASVYVSVLGAEKRRARSLRALERAHGVRVAMENMFPLRRGRVRVSSYTPGHDPTIPGARNYTLDLSHTAVAGDDAFALLERMGDRLVHLHLADGTGLPNDEHLVPGRGTQPCAEVLRRLARAGFGGTVVVEVSTRRARSRNERLDALAESLLFARLHLGTRLPRSQA